MQQKGKQGKTHVLKSFQWSRRPRNLCNAMYGVLSCKFHRTCVHVHRLYNDRSNVAFCFQIVNQSICLSRIIWPRRQYSHQPQHRPMQSNQNKRSEVHKIENYFFDIPVNVNTQQQRMNTTNYNHHITIQTMQTRKWRI